jgi:hypothetical protein
MWRVERPIPCHIIEAWRRGGSKSSLEGDQREAGDDNDSDYEKDDDDDDDDDEDAARAAIGY